MPSRGEVRPPESHRLERRHARVEIGGRPRQRRRLRIDVVGCEVGRRQAPQPRLHVRREHGERARRLREHLGALEDDVVLAGAPRDAAVGERVRDGRVAVERLRLVVVVGVDRRHAQRLGEAGNRLARDGVPHDQAPAARAQTRVEVDQAAVDEFDAPILRRGQCVQDRAVEDERRVHRACRGQRAGEGGVVDVAQVAPEPHERSPPPGAGRPAPRRGAHGALLRCGKRRSRARSSCRHSSVPLAS